MHRPANGRLTTLALVLLVAVMLTPGVDGAVSRLQSAGQKHPGNHPAPTLPGAPGCPVFPGTNRRYWVYVPAQYSPSQPASLMVFQDGHMWLDPDGEMLATGLVADVIGSGKHVGEGRPQCVSHEDGETT